LGSAFEMLKGVKWNRLVLTMRKPVLWYGKHMKNVLNTEKIKYYL